jgi:hypothetical protein
LLLKIKDGKSVLHFAVEGDEEVVEAIVRMRS